MLVTSQETPGRTPDGWLAERVIRSTSDNGASQGGEVTLASLESVIDRVTSFNRDTEKEVETARQLREAA